MAGADATFTGQAEAFIYAAASSGTYFLIADNYATDSGGAFTLDVMINCPVSIEASTWGTVKARYR